MFFIIGGVLFLMGSAFFGVSLFFALRRLSRMKKWTQTTGVVTDVEISRGMSQPTGTPRSNLYKPKVRYQIADGRVIDFEPQTSNSWSNYNVGEQIPVFYDPQQPENALLGSGHWFKLIAFVIFGAVFALFGAMFIAINLIFPF